MSGPSRERTPVRPRMARLVMTLGAWLAAFIVVLALLTLLGDELQSLPLALRALVLSGVLVFLMANLVMPLLSTAIAHWLSGGRSSGWSPARPPITQSPSPFEHARERSAKSGSSTTG
jgi:antibiotic biosynthesis monooxygenase (ABM) superfamily enzyme